MEVRGGVEGTVTSWGKSGGREDSMMSETW